ncbi:angiopoietin-1 receptor-like isoform X3 [Orbicella faveolata]|uniref:angiopoietin-1 receptor-like isoform X3 n=1 Tax=Orbicella faveolata TaxID=48498 RepID=UPI0009E24580|nr:angiopoietin-1 receptor-like isoform X3 [Orbicella faveolata]
MSQIDRIIMTSTCVVIQIAVPRMALGVIPLTLKFDGNIAMCLNVLQEFLKSCLFLRSYPLNSTAIHISWNGLHPSRHKEQLLGYRVRYRRLGSLLYEEANTTSNVTEIVVLNLVAQTKYEIEINGFNEIGHGPTSMIRVIKTLSHGEIKQHFNKSSIVRIYDVEILRFSNGSVEADIRVLAIMNKNTTDKGEAIDQLISGLDFSMAKGLNVMAIVVLEKPPPPEDLTVTNVQTRYIVFAWDQPKHGSFYQIHNYTIERKASVSENFTVVKTLPYDQTRMTLKDLEPSTEYTIRLSSNNRYGRSDGVLLTEGTLPDRFFRNLILIIVLPLTLAALFIVVVCLKFRPACKSGPEKDEMELWMRGDWVEIRRSDITLQEKLGEGAFGEAYKGLVRMDGKLRECAVKKLKANATELERRDLLNELQIMVTVGDHPNVINLFGACTRSDSMLVVVRLAENGCLLHQLKKSRGNPYINVEEKQVCLSDMDKTRIARDVASGMLHLFNKKGMLPVRWMALESLEDYTYNTKTDVWSFGVLLWEIESGGKMPYSGLGGMEVVEFIKSGKRLTKPERCPDEIYEIMMLCWRPDPSERLSFAELVTSLELELHNREDSLKVESLEVESKGNITLAT